MKRDRWYAREKNRKEKKRKMGKARRKSRLEDTCGKENNAAYNSIAIVREVFKGRHS